MNRQQLEEKAQQAICTCFHYDLANSMPDLSDEELQQIIADPYTGHQEPDDKDECPEYIAEQAEIQRDQAREDGINV